MSAYLDNSATTRVAPQVQKLCMKVMDEDFGNPSSMHKKGVESEKYIKEAKSRIAETLRVDAKDIIFTSGGTESNNLAIIGTAFACQRRGKHIITTAIEHASVAAPMAFLEEQGFEVTYLPVDEKGVISLDALREALTPDTILVSIMYVNNEVGTIQPIDEAAALIKSCCPDAIFHVDAIQAYGKLVIRPRRQGIDLLSVSGHKIHGPKGVGFLYCNPRVKLQPLMLGGGQQKGMRSGTENVPGIAGLGLAAELAYSGYKEKYDHLNSIRRQLLEGLHSLDNVKINGWDETTDGDECLLKRAPHIVSAAFIGVRSEVLLHALGEHGVFVSAGSACSSNKAAVSSTLRAMRLSPEQIESTLRFSFCPKTSSEEIDQALDALKKDLSLLRRYYRK